MMKKLNVFTVLCVLPFFAVFLLLPVGACNQSNSKAKRENVQTSSSKRAKAIFAGGCFWCMEKPFDQVEGVISTVSGYTGGNKTNPTYKEVSAGTTGHTEAIQIEFDPSKVDYSKLLEVYWVNVDPTKNDRQFCDVGTQYRPEIFPTDASQRQKAEASLKEITKSKSFKEPIVVDITDASTFYPAEDYHQDYYEKNPIRYKYYRHNCGRDARLKELWGENAGGKH